MMPNQKDSPFFVLFIEYVETKGFRMLARMKYTEAFFVVYGDGT